MHGGIPPLRNVVRAKGLMNQVIRLHGAVLSLAQGQLYLLPLHFT
jgi:hypothetical protein